MPPPNASSQRPGAIAIDLHDATIEADRVAGAIANFSKVWELMTPENRSPPLRPLVASVKVYEDSSKVELALVDFAPCRQRNSVTIARRRHGRPNDGPTAGPRP